ncbi:serine/threonine-protein kinase [Sorangium cellulosum]|uniref:serine/threonine-protein kinase n=1 Tax=Sorangium cellulosum TaxID=56 RepID=UPI00133131E3|nr:serine/threonine-protein kinase [Sorangium cellulosum]
MKPDAPASTAGIPGIGEVFAQRYRLERSLGRGSMGAIFAAEHIPLRQRVAVKFLLPRAMKLPGASARFLREARAAAAIRSEHVARVIDVGTADLGIPYLVMEYLRGRDLQQELETRGPLPVHEAVDYLIQACEAVAEAHARGIIHRDLKPGNLFLATGATGVPLVKVLDFGLSKAADAASEEDGKLTASEMMLGSPSYMSPEQVRCAKDVDARADIWSLGVVLYQLLTARFPFDTSKISALFVAIVTQAPTPPRVHRIDLPAQVEDVILRCLEKEPELRIQSVAELARELAPFGTERSARALDQIEAIAHGRTDPSWLSPAHAGDAVATTLPAATVAVEGTASTLPRPDAGAGAGSRQASCSTALAPGGGAHLATLPSEGVVVVPPVSSDAAAAERVTLPRVAVEDRPTLKMARGGGPALSSAWENRPTLTMARDQAPSLGVAPEDGPTLMMARDLGPALKMAREGGPTLITAPEDGPTLTMAREDGPTLTMAREDGPTLTMAREDGPTLTMAREDGPTLTIARGDGAALAIAPEDGPTLTIARDDFPTLAMARRRAVPLMQPEEEETAGSTHDVTERRRSQRLSSASRSRRSAGVWVAAAAVLLVTGALGATRWLGSSDRRAAGGLPPGQALQPSSQDAPVPLASRAGPVPFIMPELAAVDTALIPEFLAPPAESAAADPSTWAVNDAGTPPGPAAGPDQRPAAVRRYRWGRRKPVPSTSSAPASPASHAGAPAAPAPVESPERPIDLSLRPMDDREPGTADSPEHLRGTR